MTKANAQGAPTTKKQMAKRSARQAVRVTSTVKSYKPTAGVNTVREVSAKGRDRVAIRTAVRSAKASGASQAQAQKLRSSLRTLDKTTKSSATRRTAARKAGKKAAGY